MGSARLASPLRDRCRGRAASRRPCVAAVAVALPLLGCDTQPSLVLAATTSTYDSGLLESLVGEFETAHPDLAVRTVVVGSGEALELGRRGDVDVLIVHAPAAEARFVDEGHSIRRHPLMSNDFVLVGPPEDPAGVAGLAPAAAFARIARSGATFVSRGDSSGTHERELAIWRDAGVTPSRPWHLETGQGQGTSLQVANEREAYFLTDSATFDVLSGIVDLVPLVSGGADLRNEYSVIVPARAANPAAAALLADWMLSDVGRGAISGFRSRATGRPLFTPTPAPTRPAALERAASPPPD